MASRKPLNQVKARIERLRRDSVDVAANSSRIVLDGVQKLAEHELKAFNAYYTSASASLKSARGPNGTGYPDMAAKQLDLLDKAIRKIASHAVDSLSVLSETRAELARLVEPDRPAPRASALTRVTAPAQKAIADVTKAAVRAQKEATSSVKKMKRSLEKEWAYAEKRGRSAVKRGEVKARAVTKLARRTIDSILDITALPVSSKKAVRGTRATPSRTRRNDTLKPSE